MGHFETDVVFDVMEGYVRKIVALETENKSLREEITNLNDCNYQLHQNLNGNTVMIQSLRQENDALTAGQDSMAKQIRDLMLTNQDLKREVDGLITDNVRLEGENSNLKANMAGNAVFYGDQAKDHREEVERLNRRIDQLRGTIEHLEAKAKYPCNHLDRQCPFDNATQEATQHEDSQTGN